MTTGTVAAGRHRERAIDLFKGLLVIGMVYCHTLQFFSNQEQYPTGQTFIDLANLITFSGFVFSFGYVSQLAYYAKPFRKAAPRMALAAMKTLIAFYVSGAAYRLLVDGKMLEWKTIRPILTLTDIPGWSEFLASFTYLTVVGLVLFLPLQWLGSHKAIAFAAVGLLLLTTFLPYGSVHQPQLAPLVGTRDFASFPVIAYFPYYILGMLFARYRMRWDWRILSIAVLATGVFMGKWLSSQGHTLPERFPPSIWWILGPALLLYGYYQLARQMEKLPVLFTFIEAMGRNVLWFLVMTNLLIFSLKSNQPNYVIGTLSSLWMAILLLAIAGFGIWIMTKAPRSRPAVSALAQTAESTSSQPAAT